MFYNLKQEKNLPMDPAKKTIEAQKNPSQKVQWFPLKYLFTSLDFTVKHDKVSLCCVFWEFFHPTNRIHHIPVYTIIVSIKTNTIPIKTITFILCFSQQGEMEK